MTAAEAHFSHDQLVMDIPGSSLRKHGPGARSLLAVEDSASVNLWFGYDVHYKAHPVQRNYGNFTPRYVALRNQVLGGLYFQQVRSHICMTIT